MSGNKLPRKNQSDVGAEGFEAEKLERYSPKEFRVVDKVALPKAAGFLA